MIYIIFCFVSKRSVDCSTNRSNLLNIVYESLSRGVVVSALDRYADGTGSITTAGYLVLYNRSSSQDNGKPVRGILT